MNADFRSPYLALGFEASFPRFSCFSIDGLGRDGHRQNVILEGRADKAGRHVRRTENNRIHYVAGEDAAADGATWDVEVLPSRIRLRSRFRGGTESAPFLLTIDQRKNHATVLGASGGLCRVLLPALLHLPDLGTLQVRGAAGVHLIVDARRRQPENFVAVEFPAASEIDLVREYELDVVLVHPNLPLLSDSALYDGFRRNFLNLIQWHPRLQTLANNSSSDVCGFCFWQYAELGRKAPRLTSAVTVLDLVRASLDRVFSGGLTYGQAGWGPSAEHPEAAPWAPAFDSLDSLPSMIIAGCHCILSAEGEAWAHSRFESLNEFGRKMLESDRNDNGLIEYRLSGNSGSWRRGDRPANWWDTIGFGHEDAYANALAYRACLLLADSSALLRKPDVARFYRTAASRIKERYLAAFLNPQTGFLGGWRSADGELHDYAFTFVSGMAIAFGLVDGSAADLVLDNLIRKLSEVGFDRFDLGLPGNLIPIRREDYTDLRRKYGGPEKEDGSDSFGIYENGGATHCHAFWLIKALYRRGRVSDARRIYHPMLQSFDRGEFQGFGENGLSRDWRSWSGQCHGYEGYLSDGYLALLAVEDDLAAGPQPSPQGVTKVLSADPGIL